MYGYNNVLQHVGPEPSSIASVRLHLKGEIDLIAMSPECFKFADMDLKIGFVNAAVAFDSEHLAKLVDKHAYVIKLRPNNLLYLPATWIIWTRVRRWGGEHNAVCGVRAGF